MEEAQLTAAVPIVSKTEKPAILVVDDEKNIRLTVQHSLLAAGYDVVTATNGAEGLETFKTRHFDLVLMDLRMPAMSGIELLRAIREINQDIPAIVITAYLTVDTLLQAFELGVPDYIRKPFTPNEVRETVRRLLARRQFEPFEASREGVLDAWELSKCKLALRDLDAAIDFARIAIEQNSENPDIHAYLGMLMHQKGDTKAAEDVFRHAIMLDPQHQLSRDYLFWVQSTSKFS